jgi:hypothetical protein
LVSTESGRGERKCMHLDVFRATAARMSAFNTFSC